MEPAEVMKDLLLVTIAITTTVAVIIIIANVINSRFDWIGRQEFQHHL